MHDTITIYSLRGWYDKKTDNDPFGNKLELILAKKRHNVFKKLNPTGIFLSALCQDSTK